MCGGVFVGFGAVLASITFSACVVSLFSPVWITDKNELTMNLKNGLNINLKNDLNINLKKNLNVNLKTDLIKSTSYGLFLECKDFPRGECKWLSVSKDDQPEWFMACQWLWVIATLMMLTVSFACFSLRSETFRSKGCFSLLISGSLLAFIASACCIIIYGYKNQIIFNRDNFPHYVWGYYIAILSTAGCLLSFIIFSFAMQCIRQAEL